MKASGPRARLLDILDAIAGVRASIGSMSFDAYGKSWIVCRAAERALEIISEASRHIPETVKANEPSVPWREIAAIGNVLRHEYHRVDDEVVYTVVTRQLDELEAATRRILAALDSNG